MARLDDKVAVVTGGAAGLGKAIANRLMAEGARVIITDVQAERGRAAAAAGGFTFLEQDVSDEFQWTAIVQDVEQRFGRLDILVNNAGVLEPLNAASPETLSFAHWKKVFAVNVDGVFLGCRAAIPVMRRAGGGSIINMSSIAGLTATPYATAYGATKAAVRQLTKSVAQHCAQERLNIRCNSVHPGDVQTSAGEGMWVKHTEDLVRSQGITLEETLARAKAAIPLGDLILPQDIAAAVSFLVSDDARHITGEKLIVDGGVIHCDTYEARDARR